MFREGQSNEEMQKMRDRVDSLRDTDNIYEDSVYDLAQNENKFRDKLQRAGVTGEHASELADEYSTKDLERIEAEKEKWTDSLTGLRNAKAYRQEVPTLLSIENRQGTNCSMLIIDFDFFKRINDEHGHQAGDDALRAISKIMSESIRSSDALYRYGGEEFVIFLPMTDSKGATDLAEKIRSKVEDAEITVVDQHGQEIKLKKTISIGCVGTDQLENWGEYGRDKSPEFLDRMFAAADLSVNHSKREGRNRVTLFDQELLNK